MSNKIESMIAFKDGTSVVDLMDFYKTDNFKGGGPVYNPPNTIITGNQLEDLAVMILGVPKIVTDNLNLADKGADPLTEINVASDAIVTLAGIDGLDKLNGENFRIAANSKTIGEKGDWYEQFVQNYLRIFPRLLMTKSLESLENKSFSSYTSNNDTLSDYIFAFLSSYRPDHEVLSDYTVKGVVPAPLKSNGGLERSVLSMNIFHQFQLSMGKEDLTQASPEKVRELYSSFIK